MIDAEVTLLPAAARTAELHAEMMPQKDNLCGAFWGSLALRAIGMETDQDDVALAAGSLLPPEDGHGELPAGTAPRLDYRLELPRAADEAVSGTPAGGLKQAIERLSGGRLEVLPLSGPMTAERVLEVLSLAADADAMVIANVHTEPFWGTRPSPVALTAFLTRGEDVGQPSDWSVGHFCELAGTLRGPAAALVIVRDTYPALGLGGYHVQPPARVAMAIERRGLLVVAGPGAVHLPSGWSVGLWDNGSPETAGEEERWQT
jgi:hypothetical protein